MEVRKQSVPFMNRMKLCECRNENITNLDVLDITNFRSRKQIYKIYRQIPVALTLSSLVHTQCFLAFITVWRRAHKTHVQAVGFVQTMTNHILKLHDILTARIQLEE